MTAHRTRSGKLDILVGEDTFPACLRIGELQGLQEKLNSGPYALAMRLSQGEWMVEDVTETVRFALIGGGMEHREAARLTRTYIKEGHLFEYRDTAQQCILASLMGVEDEELPSEEDEEEPDEGNVPTPDA